MAYDRVAMVMRWQKRNPDRVRRHQQKAYKKTGKKNKRSYLCKQYGITVQQYERWLADQNGQCAICLDMMDKANFDHCHATGKPRAFLCTRCNIMLGMSRDNPSVLRNAVKYLQHFGE